MNYLDRIKQLDSKKQTPPAESVCQNNHTPLSNSFGSEDRGGDTNDLSENDSQQIENTNIGKVASKPQIDPKESKQYRCNRCKHLSRFFGGNACRTNNGLPWLFGLLYNVPDDNGASCVSWQPLDSDMSKMVD